MTKNTAQGAIGSAFETGAISEAAAEVLAVPGLMPQLQANMGIDIDAVQCSEVFLVAMLIDDSGSIDNCGNTDAVMQGHNTVLDAFQGSKTKDGILVMCRYLNGGVLYPVVQLDQAVRMNRQNYNPTGGTPLYEQAAVVFGTVLAKAQEFADSGVACRTATLIVTDGHDEHSRKCTAKSVAALAHDMLRSENHIIAAMGINDGFTNFTEIFREMGIPDKWILTPKNTPSEIRRCFALFSQSAMRASQSGAQFSATAGGGFNT